MPSLSPLAPGQDLPSGPAKRPSETGTALQQQSQRDCNAPYRNQQESVPSGISPAYRFQQLPGNTISHFQGHDPLPMNLQMFEFLRSKKVNTSTFPSKQSMQDGAEYTKKQKIEITIIKSNTQLIQPQSNPISGKSR